MLDGASLRLSASGRILTTNFKHTTDRHGDQEGPCFVPNALEGMGGGRNGKEREEDGVASQVWLISIDRVLHGAELRDLDTLCERHCVSRLVVNKGCGNVCRSAKQKTRGVLWESSLNVKSPGRAKGLLETWTKETGGNGEYLRSK